MVLIELGCPRRCASCGAPSELSFSDSRDSRPFQGPFRGWLGSSRGLGGVLGFCEGGGSRGGEARLLPVAGFRPKRETPILDNPPKVDQLGNIDIDLSFGLACNGGSHTWGLGRGWVARRPENNKTVDPRDTHPHLAGQASLRVGWGDMAAKGLQVFPIPPRHCSIWPPFCPHMLVLAAGMPLTPPNTPPRDHFCTAQAGLSEGLRIIRSPCFDAFSQPAHRRRSPPAIHGRHTTTARALTNPRRRVLRRHPISCLIPPPPDLAMRRPAGRATSHANGKSGCSVFHGGLTKRWARLSC